MERFYPVHDQFFDTALTEVRNGCKLSHWMWYIFPQVRGLGHSYNARRYALADLEEAQRFAEDPILGENLRTITRALMEQPIRNANTIFGGIDAMKLRSCMTLFELADPTCVLYSQVLEVFFDGNRDDMTLSLL